MIIILLWKRKEIFYFVANIISSNSLISTVPLTSLDQMKSTNNMEELNLVRAWYASGFQYQVG